MINIAINGYGRIGRNILRAFYERPALVNKIRIVAINDLGSPEINAHLTQYDTTHGRFPLPVSAGDDCLQVGDDTIRVFSERDPEALPWADLDIDVVLECTGFFTDKASASKHLRAGARRVLISAPAKDVDATVVYGVNHESLSIEHTVVSNASCTTNCLAPLVAPLHAKVGLESGLMTTIHAYTNDQNLSDVYHSDLYRARAAAHSMIPTKTGAASAIGLVMPELKGRLDGLAVRVPTLNVSLVDLSFVASRDTSVEEINEAIKAASETERLKGILGYTELPLVSTDYNHSPYSSFFAAPETKVMDGNFVRILTWYDNEWGFSNRMSDTAVAMMNAK